nr:hypothetical protein [Tanacetum cinerariifolium]
MKTVTSVCESIMIHESIPEADIPLQKRARFITPTSRYETGESSVAAAARQIRPTLTITESRRADENGTKEKDHEKMAPKRRTTRLNPARDETRNGDDSHTIGTGARRPVQAARECSYSEFIKCKPLDFKVYEEASKVESCHSEISLDDLLALDSIVRFDFE